MATQLAHTTTAPHAHDASGTPHPSDYAWLGAMVIVVVVALIVVAIRSRNKRAKNTIESEEA